jgi:hypothetical protein
MDLGAWIQDIINTVHLPFLAGLFGLNEKKLMLQRAHRVEAR